METTIVRSVKIFGALLQKAGPYLLLEILLPGGTLFALLLFLYKRRQRDGAEMPRAIFVVVRAFGKVTVLYVARLWHCVGVARTRTQATASKRWRSRPGSRRPRRAQRIHAMTSALASAADVNLTTCACLRGIATNAGRGDALELSPTSTRVGRRTDHCELLRRVRLR
jgi:hypothetical protein